MQSLEDACNAAFAEGVLIVAAAGNSGNKPGNRDTVEYPGGYASVIAVAASDSNDARASFSSTEPDVELIAPGVSILSSILEAIMLITAELQWLHRMLLELLRLFLPQTLN